MLVLRFVFKLVAMLHSEISASSLAAGLALGLALGLMPLLSLQAVVVIALVLFLRVNISAALVAFFFFKGAAYLLSPALDSLGTALLSADGLASFWRFATNAPGLSLCSIGNTVSLGGTVAAVVLFAPAALACRFLILRYRTRFMVWAQRSRLLAFIKGHSLYRLYQTALSPLF